MHFLTVTIKQSFGQMMKRSPNIATLAVESADIRTSQLRLSITLRLLNSTCYLVNKWSIKIPPYAKSTAITILSKSQSTIISNITSPGAGRRHRWFAPASAQTGRNRRLKSRQQCWEVNHLLTVQPEGSRFLIPDSMRPHPGEFTKQNFLQQPCAAILVLIEINPFQYLGLLIPSLVDAFHFSLIYFSFNYS